MALTVLETTLSTNSDAKDMKYTHGDAVLALEQTAGRGQRGNKWLCRPGENLTFSLVLEPVFLPVVKQFLLSEGVALALVDTLAEFGIEARIKWPNDIYVADNKICGVLIENNFRSEFLSRSIVGIGLNVNQREFDPSIPNPTSMLLERGERYDMFDVYNALYSNLMGYCDRLASGEEEPMEKKYLSLLYGLGEERLFERPSGERFRGTICDVRPTGELIIEHAVSADGKGSADGKWEMESFLFKEVKYCL